MPNNKKSQSNSKGPAKQGKVKDLPSKSTREKEAGDVKGGAITLQPFVITKVYDKSSP
jgi:type VI protein secretion system component Hcp